MPADSENVSASDVSEMRFASTAGKPGDWFWTVVLTMRNEPFKVSVQISELSDRVTASRAEQ